MQSCSRSIIIILSFQLKDVHITLEDTLASQAKKVYVVCSING